jgi:hypothetical protein
MDMQPSRIYTTPTSLAQARFVLDGYTAAEVWDMIRDVSAEIDSITQHLFNGEYGTYECDGRGRRIAYHPRGWWFCHIESITHIFNRTNEEANSRYRDRITFEGDKVLNPNDYVLKAGLVESVFRDFAGGPRNVQVVGVVGRVEPFRMFSSVTTTEIDETSDYVDVADASGFQPRDVLDIFTDEASVRVIINRIDRTLSRLYFDPLGAEVVVPVDATVRTFGATPRAIELVSNYLVGVTLRERAANVNGQEPVLQGRIRREKTDDYEIEFQISDPNATLTGSKKFDSLLAPYILSSDVRII